MSDPRIRAYEQEYQRLKAHNRTLVKDRDAAVAALRQAEKERDENWAGWQDAAKLAGELREELRATQQREGA